MSNIVCLAGNTGVVVLECELQKNTEVDRTTPIRRCVSG